MRRVGPLGTAECELSKTQFDLSLACLALRSAFERQGILLLNGLLGNGSEQGLSLKGETASICRTHNKVQRLVRHDRQKLVDMRLGVAHHYIAGASGVWP